MDQCLKLADWNGFPARRKDERSGAASCAAARVTPYIELGGVFNERMEIRFDPGGMVTIIAGTHSHGQGHATAFAQLVSRMARRAVRGDQLHPGRYREGRRSAAAPLRRAARWSAATGCASRPTRSSPAAKEMAGALMEAAPGDIEFRAGTFTVVGTDRRMSIGEVARAFFAPAGPVLKLGLGLEASAPVPARRAARPTIRTAVRYAKSRSIRKPAKCTSTASSRSTISAW